MTAVASPPSFQQNSRSTWGTNMGGGLTAMNADEVARMFMPRKSAQRAKSSSSISSNSSAASAATIPAPSPPPTNGVPTSPSADLNWGTAAARKKTHRAGPWPAGKPEATPGTTTARPQQVSSVNGGTSTPLTSILQLSPIVPSQHVLQNPTQQANNNRPAGQGVGEANPVLYLLSMNGTFERKTISVPYYPDSLRIGRQTNSKTLPTPANGFFDSKVLSRQHAEIWSDPNGNIWIRDVKSSNGTFVNGARLSAENRDSEPHELQTQDHLELGIDIVSEDQKTVVHHKVAAKVEHAGFLGTTNNVLDMNFGDLDMNFGDLDLTNGAMMASSQGSLQMRGRQGSVGSNSRMGPPSSVAASQMSQMSQQRPMNFWLTPITTEQIVKRLTHEMRIAKSQTNELGRTDTFFGSLLSKENIKEIDKPPVPDAPKGPVVNSSALPFRTDVKPRFSDPPAPPPQCPLPEKPDVARSHPVEPASPALKRSNPERPKSVPNASPVRPDNPSQIVTLLEALAAVKKENEVFSARMRDLEEMLSKEREARQMAEETAKQLQLQTDMSNGVSKALSGGNVIEEAFEPPSEAVETGSIALPETPKSDEESVDTKAIIETSNLLEQQMQKMSADMQEMRVRMENFKNRAETAETERDADRKTLAEMVEKIRADEAARRSFTTERSGSPTAQQGFEKSNGSSTEVRETTLDSLLNKNGATNGSAMPSHEKDLGTAISTLSRSPGGQAGLLHNTAPYASMLGVVLLGMGLMALLNNWQPPKVDR